MTPHLDGGSLDAEAVSDVLGAHGVAHGSTMTCNPRVDKCRPRDYNGDMTNTEITQLLDLLDRCVVTMEDASAAKVDTNQIADAYVTISRFFSPREKEPVE